jgi:hypothetical protein
METIYYRKIAQIACRDGDREIRDIARSSFASRTIKKATKRKLKAWFLTWLDKPTKKSS